MNQLFPVTYFKPGILLVALLLSCFGCSGAKDDPRGERHSVSGLVYFDGDPITSARILFISDTPKGKMKSAGIVRQGIYQIPEQGGPVVGKARVEIYPSIPEMEEVVQMQKQAKKRGKRFHAHSNVKIPAAYNRNSKLTAEITQNGKNTFDFKIESK